MSIQFVEIGELLKTKIVVGLGDLALEDHIEAGMKWLSHAQDATNNGGVSIRFSLARGWESSYPETTGYIIPTFLKYYDLCGDNQYMERAVRMAEWELSIQKDDGSFIGGALDRGIGSLVFDTGQIIFGLVCAYLATKDEKFLSGARKAGNWLVDVQDEDGAWRKNAYNSIPHTYYSRVSWALLELYQVIDNGKYLTAAKNNITWVLSNQNPNGWFQNSGFTIENNRTPYTHTIAYTVRGLLEAGILLEEQQYIDAVRRTADELLNILTSKGFFWGMYDKWWKRSKRFSCLTGNAQFSNIYLRLFQTTKESKYLEAACALNNNLRKHQDISTDNRNIRGAIAGSSPIWGEYERFAYPNWATKFFVDALMLEAECRNKNSSL